MNQNAWTTRNHRKHKILGNTGIWVAPHQTLTTWRCLKSWKSVCSRRIFSSLCPLWTDLEHKKRRVKKKSFSSWSSVELSRFRCLFRAVRRETMSRLQHCPPPFYPQDRTLCKLGGDLHFPAPTLKSVCFLGCTYLTLAFGKPSWIHNGLERQTNVSLCAPGQLKTAYLSQSLAPCNRQKKQCQSAGRPLLMGLSGINLATKTSQVGFSGKQTVSWKLAGCLLVSELHTWAKTSPQNLSCSHGWAFQVVPTGYKEWPAPLCWDAEWEMLGQGHKLQIRSALEGPLVMPPLI